MSGKDTIFKETQQASDFKFGENVVSVFDDMVVRSVPFYLEIQRMMTEIAADFAVPGTSVYDLGCSTGTTLRNLDTALPEDISFVGIDDSQEMLEKCRHNLEAGGITRHYELKRADLNQGVLLHNPSVVVMCLTLQFIRPLYREKLLREIYDQLNPNSCFILIEKVLGEDSLFNRLFIKYYYDFKRRNHYDDMEIAQKREALENVLIPYKLMENRELLHRTGFRYVETFFKWYNFSGMVAVK
ncbi:MAG TPA: carboxy-S-adenosyl-L-methionine synthase CmoA [Chitinophagaceae bacterium]|nr:carboxy-S-adenosyl-L-methionine synthase CmoA [Chitinophagaceae bacterium]